MKVLKKYVKGLLGQEDQKFPLVFSHPRSGTHFLEAFIAENFLKGQDLEIPQITWGHWANRKVKETGNPYGKLFGSHAFPRAVHQDKKIVYIIRDPRAVAYSIWKTPNFIHPDLEGIGFSDFLRTKLDWKGSPAFRAEPTWTILEHWAEHVAAWSEISREHSNILVVHYEDLLNDPYSVYLMLHRRFFNKKAVLEEDQVNPIRKAVGLLPNAANKDSWRQAFTAADHALFEQLSEAFPILVYTRS